MGGGADSHPTAPHRLTERAQVRGKTGCQQIPVRVFVVTFCAWLVGKSWKLKMVSTRPEQGKGLHHRPRAQSARGLCMPTEGDAALHSAGQMGPSSPSQGLGPLGR